jgi:hypothetical protein
MVWAITYIVFLKQGLMHMLIPYRSIGRFILFAFNLGEINITIRDPIPYRTCGKEAFKMKDTIKAGRYFIPPQYCSSKCYSWLD